MTAPSSDRSSSPTVDPAPSTDARAVFERALASAHARFEQSADGTLGIEEEYAICDPQTLDLVPRFDELEVAATAAGLTDSVASELLASEVEFRTSACESWADVRAELRTIRAGAVAAAEQAGYVLGASGTHPWADYRELDIVQHPYYLQLVRDMGYAARRNNTFGLHVHVGVQGGDRAIRIHDALRTFQPVLLALSASSPFLDGCDTDLASVRHMIFSRSFVRGNVAPSFGTLDGFVEHMRWLHEAGSLSRVGQVWWGTRPHVLHGTIEFRMFDGQPGVDDTLALAALASGVVAWLGMLDEAGELPAPVPTHQIEENAWRAARWGLDAQLAELPAARTQPAREAARTLVGRARTASDELGLGLDDGLDRIESIIEHGSSVVWQRRAAGSEGDLMAAYRSVVDVTMGGTAPEA